jgi:3alpha(or 20beta)-hydroxysteroid dehydrogenase
MTNSNELIGSVALVTGASSGIGEMTALTLARQGAAVAIAARRRDRLDALARRISDAGGTALAIEADVTSQPEAEGLVTRTVQEFGRLDTLVNNAGIVKMGPLRGSSLTDWQQVIDVNLTGAYLGMRYAIEPMITVGGGSIINISSVEGLAGSAHLHAYVAAKFGLRGITKSAAVELAAHNIRVNSIHPGLVHTPLSHGVTEAFMAPIPLKRGASPEEISQFVVFLASDECTYATGAEFVVDGGLTSYVPVKM